MSNLMPLNLEGLSRAHDLEHELDVARRESERDSGKREIRRAWVIERIGRALTRRGRSAGADRQVHC